MLIWFYSLSSVVVVSLLSLVGVVAFAVNDKVLKSALVFLVSFAVGGLFGDVFIHILPDVFDRASNDILVSFCILGGILLFFVLEKFVYWRHCHSGECDMHGKPAALLNLVGDGFHNFIDGMMIGASYSVSIPIGFATTLAVVFHEIPQEIGDFGILINSGMTRKKALGLNFLCASFSIFGAILALLIGPRIQSFGLYVLSLTAGGFIYLAGSDLIPELHRELDVRRSLAQLISILLGVGVMALLLLLEK